MAMNPMQRRARTSFIFGFLVALILGAVAVGLLLFKIKSINEAKEALEALQKKVLVAAEDIESGTEVSVTHFTDGIVQTTVDKETMIASTDFDLVDENGNPYIDEDGAPLYKKMIMKINVPAGTIITKDMLEEVDDQLDNSQRIQEFNMIALPSQLKNGDYIDVRMTFPNGQDFIVLSKKKVLGTNATTVWLKLDELELALINNAIVESYMASGIKLYAIEYVEPGRQKEAIPTYVVSADVSGYIARNPNALNEAKNKYSEDIDMLRDYRALTIETALDATRDQRNDLVSAGNANEAQSIKALRQQYVDSLEGTENIGYTSE